MQTKRQLLKRIIHFKLASRPLEGWHIDSIKIPYTDAKDVLSGKTARQDRNLQLVAKFATHDWHLPGAFT